MAQEGILTLVPSTVRSKILPLDIEYCTWANPNSEVCYFGVDDTVNWSKSTPSLPLVPLPASMAPPVLADRRKIWRAAKDGKACIAGTRSLAALIFLSAAQDNAESRQMVRLLVESLVATEFAGEILLWREAGEPVMMGKNAAEVTERQGDWSGKTGAAGAKVTLWADPALAAYDAVLLLRPGALACRNVEYLLDMETGWRTLAGRSVADSLVSAGKPLGAHQLRGLTTTGGAAGDRRPNSLLSLPSKSTKNTKKWGAKGGLREMPVLRGFERGAVVVWDCSNRDGTDERSANPAGPAGGMVGAGTLLQVEAKDAVTQLQGVWQAWLARFAPEQAAVLAPMLTGMGDGTPSENGENTGPACREGRLAVHLKTSRRSRTS